MGARGVEGVAARRRGPRPWRGLSGHRHDGDAVGQRVARRAPALVRPAPAPWSPPVGRRRRAAQPAIRRSGRGTDVQCSTTTSCSSGCGGAELGAAADAERSRRSPSQSDEPRRRRRRRTAAARPGRWLGPVSPFRAGQVAGPEDGRPRAGRAAGPCRRSTSARSWRAAASPAVRRRCVAEPLHGNLRRAVAIERRNGRRPRWPVGGDVGAVAEDPIAQTDHRSRRRRRRRPPRRPAGAPPEAAA